jgi:ribonuclease T2
MEFMGGNINVAGRIAALALAVFLAVPDAGRAQSYNSRRGGDEPGDFDYYVMALSWSPTYCADKGPRDGEPQCNGPRPYAFVLHGLWPQHTRGWPQFCNTGQRPWVPERTIDDMLDIMPSRKLIINEYKKHGTCSGLSPDAYYDLSRKAFQRIKIPDRYQRPSDALRVTPGEVVDDFVKANPDLRPEMIAVSCDRRLRELRICFDRDLKLQACGSNENRGRLCSRDEVILPPVRAGRL